MFSGGGKHNFRFFRPDNCHFLSLIMRTSLLREKVVASPGSDTLSDSHSHLQTLSADTG